MKAQELPIGRAAEQAVEWLLANAQPLFDTITIVVAFFTGVLEQGLLALPAWLVAGLVALLAGWRVGLGFAAFTLISFALIVGMGMWQPTMATLALVMSATLLSLSLGLPIGILCAKSDLAHRLIRPLLDLMQTMPAFVYLIPAAMFFGLGKVPGAIATIIFATPPAVRLTDLGIRQVPREITEAGLAFGCNRSQLLFKVELPTALPTIMAGVNQTMMLALSMVVIASMIGGGGLGNVVLRGIQRMDIGMGFEGGIGVVLLAIILDRITQSFAERRTGLLTRLVSALGLNRATRGKAQ